MSAPASDPYGPDRIDAAVRAAHRLSLGGTIAAAALIVLAVGLELLLPVSDLLAVRDGVAGAVVVLTSVALLAIAVRMRRNLRGFRSAYRLILATMCVGGILALALGFALDIAFDPSITVPLIAVPVALVLGVVLPGVYLAFPAKRVAENRV